MLRLYLFRLRRPPRLLEFQEECWQWEQCSHCWWDLWVWFSWDCLWDDWWLLALFPEGGWQDFLLEEVFPFLILEIWYSLSGLTYAVSVTRRYFEWWEGAR